MKRVLLSAVLACAMLLSGLPAPAFAAYPDRPVNIIIPFGPGGAVDIAARILAEYFSTKHNITLNIICKGGGAGAPAMLDVAKARPDGYTFGFPALATFSTTPQVKKTGYTLNDFRAVVQITNMWLSLAVKSDSGIKTINELMEAAKANPGKYNFATHGALSTQRLFMLRLMKAYPGVELPHIAYTSGHDVSTAVLGGHVTSGFGVTTNQKPYVLSGDFTMIGVSSPERLAEFPDVPTFAEQVGPEYTFASSHGLLAPKRVPNDRVEKMQNLVKEALADPDVQAKFAKAGLTTDYLPADEFQKVLNDMWAMMGTIVKENKLN
ncbi:MAG TPA: tripartite tricarboxylate transporter substrate binding protein [Candidatus Bilophila faecipullorum]|uniref:Tripartite tricarboxylate transporter substrate binding protein n=1 Tax=Candidatus Bilophila faecipullorum TaxID=2838482 RepID=A0A9D1R0U7_9BACT|nr:tripartite tricarboxylate transporter substrate binding protein [uncultured Bilophila sp.]HIW79189.1 tripartite tricarboxylate transporter substrate binding protein [Candidatus Bilophila faecipullorum]